MDASTPQATSITHVALSVRDLDHSIAWYSELWSQPPVHVGTMLAGTEHEHRVAVWAEPALGLHCFDEQVDGLFSPRRAGLDHLAFGCSSRDELERWADHLDGMHARRGQILDEPYGSGLAFWDPDGIALEFYVSAF